MNILQKAAEWNILKNDLDRLAWLRDNPGIFQVNLDNDDSSVSPIGNYKLSDEEEDELYSSLVRFDDDFGEREGVYNLFKMLGIVAKPV